MTIQSIDPQLIDPNPYQPASRTTFTADQLADLDSIATIGLQQRPKVRPHADHLGRYQLLFGHRRVAWWRLHTPDVPLPCEAVDAKSAAKKPAQKAKAKK